jgi:hypothetical protein
VLAWRGRNGGAGRLMRLLIDQEAEAMFESFWSATAGEAAAAAALNGVIGASGEYRLASSSARPA